MIYMLSFLMVSTIDYFSFKEVNIRDQKPFNVLVSIILILIVIAYKPKIMLFFIASAYILSGPVITLYRFCGKHSRVKTDTGGISEVIDDRNVQDKITS